jgi:uncharacterized protein YfkK (UPF0435 family)
MDEDNRKSSAIVLAAVLTGGVAFMVYAYRAKLLDKAKERTKKIIKSVDLKDYDKEDRNQIKRMVRKYSSMVERARDKIDVYDIKETFEDALADFKTSAKKLAEAKIDALRDIYEYGMDKYGRPGSEKVNVFASKYAEQIKHAADRERVHELQKEFREKASRIFGRQGA